MLKSSDPWSWAHRSSCFSEMFWWQTLFPDIQVDAVWPIKPTQSKLPHGKNTLGWAEHHHCALQSYTDKTAAAVKQDTGSACHSRTGPRRPSRGGPEWLFSHLDSMPDMPESVRSQKFYILIGCCVWKPWQEKKAKKQIQPCLLSSGTKSRESCYHVAAIENMVPGAYSRPVNMCAVSQQLRSLSLGDWLQ